MENEINTQNTEPIFETSDVKIFTNLHIAAVEKTASRLGFQYDERNTSNWIVNTGLALNGNDVENVIAQKEYAETKGQDQSSMYANTNGTYEVGIVLEWTDFQNPDLKELTDSKEMFKMIEKENSKSLYSLKSRIQDALSEYMLWFTGDGKVDENEMVMFIPDYNNGSIGVDSWRIVDMSEEKQLEYFKEHGKNKLPRLGFKIGYTIEYGK